ncbi:MAG: SDR family NAD(P)-dependent oxidoreductase [Hyphomicrobiaceae bacterium]
MSGSRPVALVTGAASGIGAATADHLIGEGWRVIGIDLESAPLAEVRASRTGPNLEFRAADVTDEPAILAVVDEIEAAIGPIAGVVNCAGIARDTPTLDHPVDAFRKILDVNVVGSFIVARAAARKMSARKQGAIVNIASISGIRGSKGRAGYGASKGAVITLTKVMATDLAGFGIRVNAIAPGPIETPMVQAMHTAADRELFHRFVPMARYAEPREIASVIAFLLDNDKSSFITGEIIAVDGGFRGAGVIER